MQGMDACTGLRRDCLSGLLVCLMLTGCGYVWRGQEGSLSENSVLGNGSKTLKIKSVEQTSLYPWLTYQVRSLRYGTTSTPGTWRSGWMTDRLTIP